MESAIKKKIIILLYSSRKRSENSLPLRETEERVIICFFNLFLYSFLTNYFLYFIKISKRGYQTAKSFDL